MTTATTGTHHHKRKPKLSDKVAGAAEKLVGKVERRPGKEAAGTKRMRGTDGRGGHHAAGAGAGAGAETVVV